MSYFGANIRKIRTIKKLSQTDFAKLFELTRASVGAYEEGRAEAKIDKVIEIADYFNLTLDQLLRKKITVNEIIKYDKIEKVLNFANKKNNPKTNNKADLEEINKKLDFIIEKISK